MRSYVFVFCALTFAAGSAAADTGATLSTFSGAKERCCLSNKGPEPVPYTGKWLAGLFTREECVAKKYGYWAGDEPNMAKKVCAIRREWPPNDPVDPVPPPPEDHRDGGGKEPPAPDRQGADQQQPTQQQIGEGHRLIDLGKRQTGAIYPFVFEARNASCTEPQDFRFEPNNIPWLGLPQGKVARGIGQGQTKELPAQLNFSQTPPGRYGGLVEVTCDTCGWFILRRCHIDKEKIELVVIVTPRLVQGE